MRTQTDHAPAYLLHLRPYRDNGGIVELLTRDHGRVSLFVNGVRPSTAAGRRSTGLAGLLQPFTALLISWRGNADGGQLTAAEAAGPPRPLPPARVMSGFYLNELVLKLLAREDPHPEIFDAYSTALAALSDSIGIGDAALAESRALRLFEHRLLEALGLCADFAWEAASGEAVEPGGTYHLRAGAGLVRTASRGGLAGTHLLALAQGDLADPEALATARRVLRELLDAALDGRPLLTRRVARSVSRVVARADDAPDPRPGRG
jgi:DNA repair protein RecO (recombination protein O)